MLLMKCPNVNLELLVWAQLRLLIYEILNNITKFYRGADDRN